MNTKNNFSFDIYNSLVLSCTHWAANQPILIAFGTCFYFLDHQRFPAASADNAWQKLSSTAPFTLLRDFNLGHPFYEFVHLFLIGQEPDLLQPTRKGTRVVRTSVS